MTWTEDFCAAVDERVGSTLARLDAGVLVAAHAHPAIREALGDALRRAFDLREARRHLTGGRRHVAGAAGRKAAPYAARAHVAPPGAPQVAFTWVRRAAGPGR